MATDDNDNTAQTDRERALRARADREEAEQAGLSQEERDKRQLVRDAEKLENADKIIARLKEIEGLGYARNDIDKQEIDNAIEKIRLQEEELRLHGTIDAAKQKAMLEQVDALEAQKEGMDSMEGALQRALGITQDGGKMFDNWADKAAGAAKKFGRMMTASNMAAGGISKIKEATLALAFEQDAAAVAFNRATGQAGTYTSQIQGLERSMFNAGVTSADASQAFQDLFSVVTDFSNMSKSTQMDLAKNVALLNELGVSSSESAQSIQFLTKVMGKSTTQATTQTRELFAFAQELGVSAAGMSADFIKMQPQIAALGDSGVQAFKDLQAQAKATGISFDSLLSITAKFDTFSSAADQVGKLNAVMGGPFLNTLEMVAETDPAERMRKLSEGINASGLSFDQMSYYQKKAMTSAAGLNSEMELAMLMSGKLESARGPAKTTAEFQKLAEETAHFTTAMEEMKQLGMSLAVSLGPIVTAIKFIIDGLTAWAPLMKGITAGLLAYVAVSKTLLAIESARALMKSIQTKGAAAVIGGATFAAVTAGIGLGVGVLGYSAMSGGPSTSGKGFATGGVTPGGLALVGERGPEMVSLPKGSQVAANGSAGYNRMIGAYKDGSGASSTDVGASRTPPAPVVHVKVLLGTQELKQLVYSVDLTDNTGGTVNQLATSVKEVVAKEIMKNSPS